MSTPRARFPLARQRLMGSDFERIYKLGRRAQGAGLAVVVLENERGHARLGLSVAKRHHKSAVRRNRVRRVFREAFRLSLGELPGNLDVVMILTGSAPVALQLAAEKGITPGSWVRVWSKRGEVKAVAVVTKRIKPLICDGKPVHVVGIPLHWGFTGQARKGWGPNSLTPFVGDANIETPEYKAFLVNIEPTTAPATV